MKTQQKTPRIEKAVNCPKLQEAIDEFFEWGDADSFQYDINVCIMPSVLADKDNDRRSLASLFFLANSMTTLFRALQPHVTPKKGRLCQN